jgi:hypothetical protein
MTGAEPVVTKSSIFSATRSSRGCRADGTGSASSSAQQRATKLSRRSGRGFALGRFMSASTSRLMICRGCSMPPSASRAASPTCSLTGAFCRDAAEQWEPDEARVSRPFLRGRGGDTPAQHSPSRCLQHASIENCGLGPPASRPLMLALDADPGVTAGRCVQTARDVCSAQPELPGPLRPSPCLATNIGQIPQPR